MEVTKTDIENGNDHCNPDEILQVNCDLLPKLKEELSPFILPASSLIYSNPELDVEDHINKSKYDKVQRPSWRRYIGIILGIFSSMLFALSVLFVKILIDYHPYSVSFWRFQGIMLPSLPVIFYCKVFKKQPVLNTIWPLTEPGRLKTFAFLCLRGLIGASSVVLQFYSLQFMSLADSSVISFSTPVFVSLASHFLLKEKSGLIPILCGLIALGGVVIITRPPILTGGDSFDSDTLIGASLALGCMFCATATFLLLRYLRQVHFSVMTGFFGFWGSLQTFFMALFLSEFQYPVGLYDWTMALALAIFTYLGLTSITIASKYEQASIISICRTCDIIFAFLWQFIFLGVHPDGYSFVGGVIVVSGVLLAALRKFVGEHEDDNTIKKRLWILLI